MSPSEVTMPRGKLFAPLLLGATALTLVACRKTETLPASAAGVWVSGSGSVTAVPDIAILSLGVESRSRTVQEARDNAAKAMTTVIASLKDNGLADRDVQTHSFNVSPEYNFVERSDSAGRRTERVLIGYVVTNQVSVKVRALDRVGRTIDDVVRAGGDLTRISGINFTVDDPAPLRRQARDKAVADALAKAEQIARAAGVSLGRAYYLNESSFTAPAPQAVAGRMMAAEAFAAPTPISGGELEIMVSVQAAFTIQ
ncbi:MAG: DUF541 domain-containing protein [SAR202 cluster bacterium]|nr:DUF541 domain-containing protein [SAR202 cluster bacterium]